MKAIIQVELIGPDEELAKAGETYATLSKAIDIGFVPSAGLRLKLEPTITDQAEYGSLFSKVINKTGCFRVELVTYLVEKELIILQCNQAERTLEGFQSYIKLLRFYGFEHGLKL